jgi:hypothetical protein
MRLETCRSRWRLRRLLALAWCLALASLVCPLAADEPPQPTAEAAGAKPAAKRSPAEELATDEEKIFHKFDELEKILLRMAEQTATSDPKRAALLRKAVAQSKERLIALQLERLVGVLRQDRLAVAVDSEQEVEQELARLLDLLLSEQRSDKLKDERERVKAQIRRLKELINRQVQLQAETAGSGEAGKLAEGQGKLARETGQLARDMAPPGNPAPDAHSKDDQKSPHDKPSAQDDGPKKPADGDKQPGDPKDKDASENKPADKSAEPATPDQKPSPGQPGKNAEGKPPKGDAKPGKSQPGPKGSPQSTPPQSQQPGEPGEDGGAQQPPPATQDTPGRKRVAAAEQKMEDARKKLEEAKRDGATKDQEDAVRELEQAKAELEEILRQLRDEEVERVLAQLEARFRHMLALQQEVYEGTKRVDRIPAADRGRNDEIEAGRLSRKESMIALEAEQALAVLREEGSAVAFPEAVEQMHEDMLQVVARLGQAKVDRQTQGLEEDIIAALEEMISSLERAQRDKNKQKPGKGQGGDSQEPALVDRLAELKMIRSLQMRINTRTRRYAELVQGDVGQSEEPDLIEALKRLAEREERVFRATRDIVVGKNQ